MAAVPARVASRIVAALKRFQPILDSAKKRDVNESDTVVLVTDLLHEMFGYDKYAEITSEHMIRSTFCDLAIKLDGELAVLVEIKSIGTDLRDLHVKQAVDYAANQGADWVILTNAHQWKVYKVTFEKPIGQELIVEFNLLEMSVKDGHHVELLSLLARESWIKARLGEYASRRQALSRFFLGAIVLSDPVLQVIRRELRRVNRDVQVEADEIQKVLCTEVLKREVIEGEAATLAKRQVAKAANRSLRATTEKLPVGSKPEIAEKAPS